MSGLPRTVLATLLILLAVLSITAQRPPRAVGATVPDNQISAVRAARHVAEIAQEPRPIGSPAHRRAREILLHELAALGLETDLQVATSVRDAGAMHRLVRVENVLARLAGRASTGAVLLVAHYDSVPESAGASDNAAAVAALLETARALSRSPALTNDVIFLLSDAEEVGLDGARAFVDQHPWAARVAVVLNFEARGHRGPVYMFETGPSNGSWISHLASTPRALGSSLYHHIYQLLPNDTDFTVFREAGYAGFNFAFIEGLTHYHTALDRPAQLDLGSLQHQGQIALSLTRRLGDIDLAQISRQAPDRAFFNVFGALVHYPRGVGYVLLAMASWLLAILLRRGLQRGLLTSFGIWQGFLAHFGALVAIPVAITLLWLVLRDVLSVPVLMSSPAAAPVFMLGFALLALAAIARLYRFVGGFVELYELAAAGLLWWWLLAALTSGPLLPVESNFLFAWPLLATLAGFAWLVRSRGEASRVWARVAVLVAMALPALVLVVPFVFGLYVGLQSLTQVGGLALVPAVLLSALLVPHVDELDRGRFGLVRLATLAGILVLAFALWQSAGEELPRADSVLYAYDADRDERHWYSLDAEPSVWALRLGLERGKRGSFARFLPSLPRQPLVAPAPIAPVPSCEIEILRVASDEEGRRYDLRIRSEAGVRLRYWRFAPSGSVVSLTLAGVEVTLAAVAESSAGLLEVPALAAQDLALRVAGAEPFVVTVVEQHEGLPTAAGIVPRPAGTIPRPLGTLVRSDVTLVRRSFELP